MSNEFIKKFYLTFYDEEHINRVALTLFIFFQYFIVQKIINCIG